MAPLVTAVLQRSLMELIVPWQNTTEKSGISVNNQRLNYVENE